MHKQSGFNTIQSKETVQPVALRPSFPSERAFMLRVLALEMPSLRVAACRSFLASLVYCGAVAVSGQEDRRVDSNSSVSHAGGFCRQCPHILDQCTWVQNAVFRARRFSYKRSFVDLLCLVGYCKGRNLSDLSVRNESSMILTNFFGAVSLAMWN